MPSMPTQVDQNAYRKIDVDAFDEDRFVEDEELLQAKFSADDDAAAGGAAPASSGRLVANVTNVDLHPPRQAQEIEKQVNSAAQEVRQLLTRGGIADALKIALANAPTGSAPQQTKLKHTQTVMDILSAVKATDIPNILKGLSQDDVDTLMKYVYRGMEYPDKFNPQTLLSWHEKTFEVGGVGCIVRVMTDRRTV
ncbi:hypothetical protein MP228_002743 [Amoeboaphelidium protococcarum]|nr:hypothetical protein MP228_002743 [Amoeboaphelidium protococcarum]